MRLIRGYREVCWCDEGVTVTAIDPKAYPGGATVEVDETDTYHVIERDARYRPSGEPPLSILTGAFHSIPSRPGTITANAGAPLRIEAVIYDLDKNPICEADWIKSAWREIFGLIGNGETLCSPLLGQRATTLTTTERLQLLRSTLKSPGRNRAQRLYLLCNNRERREIGELLAKGN